MVALQLPEQLELSESDRESNARPTAELEINPHGVVKSGEVLDSGLSSGGEGELTSGDVADPVVNVMDPDRVLRRETVLEG
jgi:hypothetical protein